jgi:DNA polymerase zeta
MIERQAHVYSIHVLSSIDDDLDWTMALSVRIVVTDHYLTSMNTQFDPVHSKLNHQIKQVPIIRIFGPNNEGTCLFIVTLVCLFDNHLTCFYVIPGRKVCLHIHGVFPYLFVKAPTDEQRYGEQLASSLDMALNLTFDNNDTKHVFNIELVELL